jgi:hypothetical protein
MGVMMASMPSIVMDPATSEVLAHRWNKAPQDRGDFSLRCVVDELDVRAHWCSLVLPRFVA